MIEQDYLMRMIAQFVRALVHAMRVAGWRRARMVAELGRAELDALGDGAWDGEECEGEEGEEGEGAAAGAAADADADGTAGEGSDGEGAASRENPDPLGAAALLETAFGECVGMDASMLLVLSPESLAGILHVSGVDPQLIPYLAHCLRVESAFLAQAAEPSLAALRAAQAQALETPPAQDSFF